MIPRVGDSPLPAQRYTLRPGAYAILPRGGSVLLTCQYAPAPDIQLPGGGIDPGETPLQALYREVMEEIGWRIARPRRLGAFRRFVFMPEYDIWAESSATCMWHTLSGPSPRPSNLIMKRCGYPHRMPLRRLATMATGGS